MIKYAFSKADRDHDFIVLGVELKEIFVFFPFIADYKDKDYHKFMCDNVKDMILKRMEIVMDYLINAFQVADGKNRGYIKVKQMKSLVMLVRLTNINLMMSNANSFKRDSPLRFSFLLELFYQAVLKNRIVDVNYTPYMVDFSDNNV